MVSSHACLTSEGHGTDVEPHMKYDTYTYTLEGVALKDGLLVGTITVIVTSLVTIDRVARVDAVTMGETISCGRASLTGGSKEKSSVVKATGTKIARTLKDNEKDSEETLKETIDGTETALAERPL